MNRGTFSPTPLRLVVLFCLGLASIHGTDVRADYCANDVVPAATLLLPYFEVDTVDANGVNTIFSINNATAEPALGHIIFWTDYAAPTIDFDVFLTGYDVVTVDLGDVFRNGNIPITADAQTDPGDTISPNDNPAWDGSFPVCDAIFPFNNPALFPSVKERLVNGHTGQPVDSLSGACMGSNQGDAIARGYITVDSASECSLILDPSDVGYFVDGGTGIASNENQFWGEYVITYGGDPSAMVANPLVHLEAMENSPVPPVESFYSRYLGSNADNREPLPTVWAARYQSGGLVDSTDFVVWRDTASADTLSAGIDCPGTPFWYPLDETQVVCFDESEDSVEICSDANPAGCFPKATQRTSIDDLGISYTAGWCFLNLNHAAPTSAPTQSHVASFYTAADGRLAAGMPAIALETACSGTTSTIASPVFITDFESGGLGEWTSSVP